MSYPRLLALLLSAFVANAHAATYYWPDSLSCNGTLQACINGAGSGDTIEVVTAAQISAATYTITKSLTLYARSTAADFAPGTTFQVSPFLASGDVDITLRNLWIEDGQIQVRFGSSSSSVTQTVDLDDIRIDRTSGGPSLYVLNVASSVGTAHFVLKNSDISYHGPSGYGGLGLNFDGDIQLQADVTHNRFRVSPDAMGIYNFYGFVPAGVIFKITGNRIGTWQPVIKSTAAPAGISLGAYDDLTTSTDTLSLQIDHNDIYGFVKGVSITSTNRNIYAGIINNTIAYGDTAISLNKGDGTLGGRVANNIVAFNRVCGLDHGSTSVAASNDYNLYFGRQSDTCNGAAIGSHAAHGNPEFSGYNFRLAYSSPAIDAGNYSDAVKTLTDDGIVAAPDYDLGAGTAFSTIDIGAHEATFDQSFDHTSQTTNTAGDYSLINNPPIGLLTSDPLQIGSYADIGSLLPANAARNIGTWYDTTAGHWTVFNENRTAMPLGQQFFALLDIDADPSIRAQAPNTALNYFALSDPHLDGNPDATPVVTQIFAPDGSSGVYNDSSVGVWYSGSTWYVFNQKPSGSAAPTMPEGAGFNVLMPSQISRRTHAYRTTPFAVDVPLVVLDNDFLNNIGCAHPFVTATYNPNSVYVPSPLIVSYNPAFNPAFGKFRGEWSIRRGDGADIPAGAAFDVFVDAKQSRQCTEDLIWRSSFD